MLLHADGGSGRGLISHEIFHCLTRNNAEFRAALYSLIGFHVMDHEVEFGPTIRNLLLQNPDVDHDDCWGEFTIEGQKRRCALTLDTRKVLFVPYATPALIRGIHATLLEHFPKKD